ncbi:hypothetical protein [Specibacter cremeus]|uniref:hypothetical protein n=1 Tax=Specibacter cremeus TaxID=1629051 RepID=UPI000F7841C2|nr:hypothetical protein [Specibacter cremeus]
MSDTITVLDDAHSVRSAALTSVQPREITESAFRALSAAGADPAEAQEGALAVLRAEADTQDGLALLEQLLDADWAQPMHRASAKSTSWAGVTVREVCCPGQPGLRTALQLMDLAADGPAAEVRVARTTAPGIPRKLWNDLLLRRTASLQRIIAITTTNGTEYLTVRNGAVCSTNEIPSEAIAALLLPRATGPETVVIVVPGTTGLAPQDIRIPAKPLKVREDEWRRMYQLSRKYLATDQ